MADAAPVPVPIARRSMVRSTPAPVAIEWAWNVNFYKMFLKSHLPGMCTREEG